MYREESPLFYEGDLGATLRSHAAGIVPRVDRINKDQLRATPEIDLVNHLYSEFEITPITLHEDSKLMEQEEIQVDVSGDRARYISGDRGPIIVPGIRVVVIIPYSGDQLLWKLMPNQFQSVFPRAEVRLPNKDGIGSLEIVIEQAMDAPQEGIKQRLESELKSIKFYLSAQEPQIREFNSTIADSLRSAIIARKERLSAHDGVTDLLGIPLKRRGEAPPIQVMPIKRKLVRPLPPPPKSGFKPEPGISNEDYEHILSVIRHEGRTFEAAPKTFALHDEEGLRDIILAHLNGHYHGGATSETFRRKGKTDIRIEDHDRAAFVAECKIWHGEKELITGVDQLLSYLTWRDCKASLVIFNKHNSKFMELINKIPGIISAHHRFKKTLNQNKGDGEWRFVLSSMEDELRQITVNVFLFNLHIPEKTGK